MIRRDCYWYTFGGSFDKGFTIYPPVYGARCEHPKVDSFFANYNANGKDNITPNCDICEYCQSEEEVEAEEAVLQI